MRPPGFAAILLMISAMLTGTRMNLLFGSGCRSEHTDCVRLPPRYARSTGPQT